jgi:peptidoglycan/LPS O-acetylase OafA/YrhL
VVFFLISGWLVGGSLLNKMERPGAIRLYAIDRVTRLWTVLVPTFALILAFGIVTGQLDPRSIDFSADNAFSASSLAGNLAGLQRVVVPTFGGNYPLWSLANETWYYLMFPLLIMSFAPRSRAPALSVLALCAILLPVIMVLYFSIWLLGAAFSRVRIECGALTRAALLAVLAALSVYFRFYGSNDDMVLASYPQDLLLGIVFMVFLSTTVIRPRPATAMVAPLRSTATFFSNFSFTLYVVHVPLLAMIAWLGDQLLGRSALRADSLVDLGIYFAMLAGVVGFAYGFYLMFEARTYQIRCWVKSLLDGGKTAAAGAAR